MGKRCRVLSFFISCVIIATSLLTWNLGLQQAYSQKKEQLKLFAQLTALTHETLPANHYNVATQHDFAVYSLVSNRDGSIKILPNDNNLSQNLVLQAIVQDSGFLPTTLTPTDWVFYKHKLDSATSVLVSTSLIPTKTQFIEATKYPLVLLLFVFIVISVMYTFFYLKKKKSTHLRVSAVDISKHHFTELKLREEQRRIETYLDVMHSLLIISDSTGNIIETNDQFTDLVEVDQVIGNNIQQYFPENSHHQLKTYLRTLNQSVNNTVSLVMPLIAGSGKEFIIDWRITTIPTDENSTKDADILLTGLDITESIANNQALKIANNKIREALHSAESANQSKSVFLANMSHEIRTPMNGILGATELLLDQADNDEQRQLIDIIHTSSNALLNIINDILDLSKIESGNFELEQINFDLHHLCKEAYQLFSSPAQKKGIQVIYYYQAELPQFWVGDPNRIRQVLNNLLSNALKFTHSGRIDLLVTGERLANHQFDITIKIKDTGIGIAEKKVEQIFTAFKQADSNTSRKYGGTGLGLTISQYLANAMQGNINVKSELGLGSTFALKLPLKPGKVEVEPKRSGLTRNYHANVLLAEDNSVNAKVAIKILSKLGINTVIVENGKFAVNEVTHKTYDLVLMDINMPILDGISAAERIRQLPFPRNQIPILALTANAMMEDKERCMKAGMNGFVSKPIKLAHLVDELDSILGNNAK